MLPRAYGYLSALKTAYRTRPLPKPLPPRVDRSLNILFCSIVFFLVQSFRKGPDIDIQNVFNTTGTRLGVPSDVLFTRLAMLRPNGILTAADQALRSALTTKEYVSFASPSIPCTYTDAPRSRLIYLTYGPATLLGCPFCHPSQPQTYTLYSLPATVFLPHLIHLVILGLATSAALTSPLAATSRTRFVISALVLLAIDVYLNTLFAYDPAFVSGRNPSPTSLFALLRTIRPLSICFLDVLFALYLWTTSTGRFIFFPFLSDPNAANNASIESLQVQAQDLVRNSGVALQTVQAKLRAYTVARNTVSRDTNLKAAELNYWREVTRREAELAGGEQDASNDEDGIYQDEEVQAAIARVYGQGGVDVPRARREAAAFVDGVTQGLESA